MCDDHWKQADNVWSMLNDLAENDPKGYEEFLQTQMEEAKKERENRSGVLPLSTCDRTIELYIKEGNHRQCR
jgi:glutamyl-tRNA reductase